MQKARRHATKALRPLAGTWFQGLFHSPARGASHLSLTVLVRYRSLGSIQPFGMVPDNSPGIPRAPGYSGAGLVCRRVFAYGALTLRGATFQTLPLTSLQTPAAGPITPPQPRPRRFGLIRFRSPLLAESFLFSFPAGT